MYDATIECFILLSRCVYQIARFLSGIHLMSIVFHLSGEVQENIKVT
jgi:hypothetical protein